MQREVGDNVPKSENQGMKLLYVRDILLNYSSESKQITNSEIRDILEEKYNIAAERKSIYSDIERLREYGMEICQMKRGYYYVPASSRSFSYTEVRILYDMVRYSQAIPNDIKVGGKTILKRIEELMPEYEVKRMRDTSLAFCQERVKGESDFYDVMYTIYEAINNNKQIEFSYLSWTPEGRLLPKHGSKRTIVSPWVIIWNDGKCYVLCYSEPDEMMKTYRCDKMAEVRLNDNARTGLDEAKEELTSDYMDTHFSMFSGEKKRVEVIFENKLSNVVFDRFGKDISVYRYDNEHFKAILWVNYSRQFLSWLLGLDGEIRLSGSNAEEILKDMKALIPKTE
jgi:predicted DNA-binding transcriptional regulator YafY